MNSQRYDLCVDVPSEIENTKDYFESNLTCNVFSSKQIVLTKESSDFGEKVREGYSIRWILKDIKCV